jgi:hypothetical protein
VKHFAEARRDAVEELSQAAWAKRLQQACLIWDLRGRLRILVKPAVGADASALEAELRAALQRAVEGFWGNECWVWHDQVDTAERLVYEKAWSHAHPIRTSGVELRELDRHLSKETWFGAPLAPPWPLRPQMPPIISFFSFKGGVGRTTALASFAIQMARAGKSVCIIDLDLEAPGAGTLFTSSAAKSTYGLIDYLLERPLYEGRGLNLGDYFFTCDDPAIIGDGAPITVVPAGDVDALYLEKLARVDYERMLRPEAPTPPLLDLIRQIRSERAPAYVLIDSRAGLHDIGGLALNGIAHLDVLFGFDSEQSWEGLGIVVDHLGRRRIETGKAQQDCALVYAMAPPSTDPERKNRVEQYIDRAHQLFTERFYDAEASGEWPVPAIEDTSQPHHCFAIGFGSELQRARALRDMVTPLLQGDYSAFATWLLERLGRTGP